MPPQTDGRDAFIRDVILPAYEKNRQREAVLREALEARGWDFIGYYYGPTIWQAKVTFFLARAYGWSIDVEVPHTTPREQLSDVLRDALVRKIKALHLPEDVVAECRRRGSAIREAK